MTERVRQWVPDAALVRDDVRACMVAAVHRWGARWFVGDFARVARLQIATAEPRSLANEGGWHVYRSDIALRASRAAVSRMVERVLDMPAAQDLNPADTYVMAQLEQRLMEDLAAEIEAALGVAAMPNRESLPVIDPFADGPGLLINLADPVGRDLGALAVPGELVSQYIKTRLALPRRPRTTLPDALPSLDGVPVTIEARVGRVELTLEELNGLEAGDVLVLDRRLDDLVDVIPANGSDVLVTAKLTHGDSGMALVIRDAAPVKATFREQING